jgi:hypothetical protein
VTHRPADGFIIHWGYVALGAILLATAGAALATLGWRGLWTVPAVWLGVASLGFVVSVFEDRWRTVTDRDIARGAPGTCPECDASLDIIRKKTSFRVRCPICGAKKSGRYCR